MTQSLINNCHNLLISHFENPPPCGFFYTILAHTYVIKPNINSFTNNLSN